MITLKFPCKIEDNSKELITLIIRQYNSVVHFAYNRYKDNLQNLWSGYKRKRGLLINESCNSSRMAN